MHLLGHLGPRFSEQLCTNTRPQTRTHSGTTFEKSTPPSRAICSACPARQTAARGALCLPDLVLASVLEEDVQPQEQHTVAHRAQRARAQLLPLLRGDCVSQVVNEPRITGQRG
jgi:hypothetical protein